jgi:hypothetical protein
MATRLLDRQVRLLEYLTSRGAIFGDGGDAPLDWRVEGIDRRLLRLEACFSHEKRMEKIIAALPKTFRLLGADRAAIIREFVEACPPTDIGRIENARQFYDFLCARWRREPPEPPEPPFLEDVAACEFACARVRGGVKAQEVEPASGTQPRGDAVRRHPDLVLLRCAYNIRPIFEGGPEEAAPAKRDTPLAIVVPPTGEHPNVFELLPVAFDMLAALDHWTDRLEFGTAPELDELIGELARHGLIEVGQ